MALGTRDAATNEPIWKGNDLMDRAAIEGLPVADGKAIVEVVQRLSGVGEDGEVETKGNLIQAESFSSSSSPAPDAFPQSRPST